MFLWKHCCDAPFVATSPKVSAQTDYKTGLGISKGENKASWLDCASPELLIPGYI